MKFAVISDIHSNVFALEAVLADLKPRSVDFAVNLGDIFYGPIEPKATYDLLQEHEMFTISGNQDRQIVDATDFEIESNPTMQFILDDLGAAPLGWMKALPFDFHLDSQHINANIYLCHGTPNSDLIYLLDDVSLGYPRLREDHEIIEQLNGETAELICCGHSHLPKMVALSTGQLILNPGSVGLPAYTDDEPVLHSMQTFNPMASYAIVEKTTTSNINGWRVELINVPYDVDSATKACKKRKRDDWVAFLSTGRKVRY